MKHCYLRPHLFVSILAASFFLFVGAFVQLNIIPFAINSLHRSAEFGGYLFLLTAIGIAIGAVLAGRLTKHRIELTISCLAGLGMAVIFILLSASTQHIIGVYIILVLIGLIGGLFIVPFDAFIQTFSPGKRRGQVIAAQAFLGFTGVFFAPITLYLLNEVFEFSSAQSFGVVGVIIALTMIYYRGRARAPCLPLSRKTSPLSFLPGLSSQKPSSRGPRHPISLPQFFSLESASL